MFYKTLNAHAKPCHGGTGDYQVGIWMPPVKPIPCTQGYHICTEDYLLEWLASRIFEVEVQGEVLSSEMKWTVESIKLTKELTFHAMEFLSRVLSRSPSAFSFTDSAVRLANINNNETDLMAALAWQAMREEVDTALQIVPKRVAQAKAFAAYKAEIDRAWEETGGKASEYYWRRIYQNAQEEKRRAHDLEREWQRELLFSMLK